MNIWDASKYGNIATITEIIVKQPEAVNRLDSNGATPLHWACVGGKVQAIKVLLESGALIDTPAANQKSPPLHWAVAKGKVDSMLELIKAGANADLRDEKGCSVLHVAAQNGKLFCLLFFYALAVRTQPDKLASYFDSTDKFGRTPLIWAAIQNHSEVVKFLVQVVRGILAHSWKSSGRRDTEGTYYSFFPHQAFSN